MGFAAVAVEAGWHAVAELSRTTPYLWTDVVDGCGIGTAVSARVMPSLKNRSPEALSTDFLAK